MFSKTLGLTIAACVVASPVILHTEDARAGLNSPASAYCSFNSDGSGYCSGTMSSFRNSSDSTAVLVLQHYTDSTNYVSRYFYLTWAGTTKYLNISSAADLVATFDRGATSVNANVYFHWNTSSLVDTIQLWNASYQQ